MYKKGSKIIASALVFIMMLAHVSTIGSSLGAVFATDSKLKSQNSKTQHQNVEFNTYFETEEHEASKNVGQENKVVAEITVKNAGYLKNARVDFVDSNFKISNQIESEKIAKVENNSIILNQINNGEAIKLDIPFTFENKNIISEEQLNKISSAILTGTYIDEKGKECKIRKEIDLNLKWTLETENVLEAQITKYVPYDINGQKGLIMQLDVKSNLKDNVLPIKQNKIEISVPEINGIAPEEVTVYNKQNIENFTSSYDKENKIVSIIAQNEENENKEISFDNNMLNEFIITYKYSEAAVVTTTSITINASSNIIVYSYDEKELTTTFEGEVTLEEKVGDIVDFQLETVQNISKGYIYANYDREEKINTTYKEKVTANVAMPELVDRVELSAVADKYVIDTNEYTANTIYKTLKVEKEAWLKVLGQEGNVKVITENNEVVIDKLSEAQTIELNSSNVIIETSKPESDGELIFNFEKEILGNTNYTKAQMQSVQMIKQEVVGTAINGNETIVEKAQNIQIDLVEPQTTAGLEISNNNLSTVVVNEDVEFKVILNTNSIYNKLYKNPSIVIDLPEYIENINIKNIQLPFETELKIASYDVVNNNGRKQIVAHLTGTQTAYSIDAISGGANLVITADITVNNLTPNKTENIKMFVSNENEQIEVNKEINFIAPTGIVTVNKIENYAAGASLMALTENKEAVLEVQTVAQNAKAEIQVINNYNNKINNVRILGRTLMQGANDIDSSESLENTFDAPMTSPINTNGFENVSIYYSENGSATEDLANESNGWQAEVQDYSKVKSYLIVLNNYEMNIGDSIKFNYDVQVPANLGYSEETNSLYTVYFDNVKEEQTINDRAKANKVKLYTGDAPELQVELKSNSEQNSIVREGQYVKFTANIKNTGTVDAENVKLNITAPNGKIYTYMEGYKVLFTEDVSKIENPETQLAYEYTTKHTEYKEEELFFGYEESENKEKSIAVGTIPAGQTKEVEYELRIDSIEEHLNNLYIQDGKRVETEITINNIARVMADKLQKEVVSNEYKLNIEKGHMTIETRANKFSSYTLIKGDELEYTAVVEANNSEDLENLVVRAKVPNGLEIKDAKIEARTIPNNEITYSKRIEGNEIIFTINNLPKGNYIECVILAKVGDAQGTIEFSVTGEANGTGIHYSNTTKNEVSKVELSFKQNAPASGYVKEKEQITFTYDLENNSNVYVRNINFKNIIPEGMKIVNAKVVKTGYELDITRNVTQGNNLETKINSLNKNEKITVKITMEAELLPDGVTEKEITNYAVISGDMFEETTSNSVKAIIEYNKEAHDLVDGPSDKPQKEGRYIISGTAWLDTNSNGQRDEEEQILPGIEVRLLNKNTNEIVKDIDSGADKVTQTSSNGEYRFTNLPKGEYIVVFVYNHAKYDLTSYRVNGVQNSVNSDFINTNMNINGKEQTVAISDLIIIEKENVRNIDIGLIESDKSDLRLDKYISRITLTYGNTVKTYDYEDVKLAKVEIPAKELSNATVIVDYKIVVTNEGAIANYVKKIVDYIPKDMKFNSELNRDWYESTNGDLYNSSLANTKLESGESKEVTLTLTRKMTDKNVGIVNNNAELYEVYNEEGITDIDSTPANKVNGEDDMSAADVVISVKTGDAVIYTAIISVIICTALGISIYYIRKFVLRRM